MPEILEVVINHSQKKSSIQVNITLFKLYCETSIAVYSSSCSSTLRTQSPMSSSMLMQAVSGPTIQPL
jgi:hypothetical protein